MEGRHGTEAEMECDTGHALGHPVKFQHIVSSLSLNDPRNSIGDRSAGLTKTVREMAYAEVAALAFSRGMIGVA